MATYEPRTITLAPKHPDEVLTYALAFTDWSAGATISITTFTASGVTLDSSSASGLTVTFKLSGGTNGEGGTIYLKATDDNSEVFIVNGTIAVTDPAA